MRLFVKTLQSVLMVLSIMMMIFLVLDGFNPTMNFLRNDITKVINGSKVADRTCLRMMSQIRRIIS